MLKRESKANPRERSPGSDEEDTADRRRRSDMDKSTLLNPPDTLFNNSDGEEDDSSPPTTRKHQDSWASDDSASDFERMSVFQSREATTNFLDNLTPEQKRVVLKALLEEEEKSNPKEETLVPKPKEKKSEEEEEAETETEEEEEQEEEAEDETAEEEEEHEDGEENEDEDVENAAELQRKLETMPFLARVPKDQLTTVLVTISSPFTIEKKLEYLEDFLKKADLAQCETYLKDERCDFLKYAPNPGNRRLAEKAIFMKNYAHLEPIIESWGDGAQTALRFWKEREGLIQIEKMPDDPHEIPTLKKEDPPIDSKTKKDKKEKKDEKTPTKKEEKTKTPKKKKDPTISSTTPSTSKKPEENKKNPSLAKKLFNKMTSPPVNTMAKSPSKAYEEIEGVPFNKAIFDKCPQVMNILLMGATGVGKSSFINSFVNVLSFSDLNDAERSKFHVLIPVSYTHVTKDYKKVTVTMNPNVKIEKFGDVEESNEVDSPGASATQAPRSYLFAWGPQQNRKHIRLIDTPGMLDTRGTPQDDINFSKILDFVAGFKELHAICILLKPNEARSTVAFRYCAKQLFAHLHGSAVKNIFFCFTNSRGTDYGPGDTYKTLSELLGKLPQQIQLDGKYFCFDSECFRYLCAKKNNIEMEQSVMPGYHSSFKESKRQLFKLIEAISKVSPHQVDETLGVNNVRRLIMNLLRPMAEMSKAVMYSTRLMQDKVREVEEDEKKGNNIRKNLNVIVPKLYTEPLEHPVTVCTAPSCIEIETIDGFDQTNYKMICHDHCYLHGVQTQLVNNPALQKCAALSRNINCCNNCDCSWEFHMHITYKIITRMENAVSESKLRELNNIDNNKKLAEEFIAHLKNNIAELIEEKKKILGFLTDALAFLKKYSIVPVNDAFVEYLDHIIDQEESKSNLGGNKELLKQLTDYRDQYMELMQQQEVDASYRVKSIVEMYQMIEDLKKMSHGVLFKEVQELELLQLKDQPQQDAKAVDLNVGWLGWIFHKMMKMMSV